jgi:geranylgeranyl reductase family protein
MVVGAGPGGAAAAHFLSRQGFDVLLLDRAEFPRDKTCGDGLTPRAMRVLREMALLDEIVRRGCRVDEYEVVAPNSRYRTVAPIRADPGALVIKRSVLDEMLVQHATRSGARFEPKTTVTHIETTATQARVHTDTRRCFNGRIAVIATGAATSVLMKSGVLSQQPRPMLAARAYFENLQQEVRHSFQLRFDGAPMPGYGWIFPVGPKAANVGVAYMPRKRSLPTTAAFDGFTVHLSSYFAGSQIVGPIKSYPIRTDFLRAPTQASRVLLVGEAAGLVNPLTGEGIDYALESGLLAAQHITRLLEAGDFSSSRFAEYDALLHARFDRIFQFGEWVRDWYGHPMLLNVLVPLANRRPELRQLLANIVLGEREPRGFGPATMLARLILYLARTSLRGPRT